MLCKKRYLLHHDPLEKCEWHETCKNPKKAVSEIFKRFSISTNGASNGRQIREEVVASLGSVVVGKKNRTPAVIDFDVEPHRNPAASLGRAIRLKGSVPVATPQGIVVLDSDDQSYAGEN